MEKKFTPIKPIPVAPEKNIDRSELARRVQSARTTASSAPSQPVLVGPTQRRQLPTTYLQLEPMPLSAYDDNPVFDEVSAARFVGVSADTLKKWRHRKQGPDYIQYGPNGVVRYELNALMEFRDKHRIRPDSKS